MEQLPSDIRSALEGAMKEAIKAMLPVRQEMAARVCKDTVEAMRKEVAGTAAK